MGTKLSVGQTRDSVTQNDEAEKPGLAHSVLIVTAQEFVLMIGWKHILFFFSILVHLCPG